MSEVGRWRVARAVQVLADGGLIAYPTEAVFGLGCDPFDAGAFARLLRVKRRARAKGVILVAADAQAVVPLVAGLASSRWDAVLSSWPGPVTWILPARDDIPGYLTGGRGTIAVRVTAHPVASAIASGFGGAIVSTSANRSGARPLRRAIEVRCRLGHHIDHVVVGDVGPLEQPTEIRDALTGRILRASPGVGTRVAGARVA